MIVSLSTFFIGFMTTLVCLVLLFLYFRKPSIKVGILHSKTGSMADSEKPVIDATLMAIQEINRRGGVIGRKIKPVIIDGRSEGQYFIEAANKLITQEKVNVVFGCWTSECRKSIKPIFEAHNHLLVYPVQYEGLEQSENIVYTGSTPTQQIIPTIKWVYDNLGTRFYLVGSDYIFPHVANSIIRDQVAALGGEIVGETYFCLGETELGHLAEHIIDAKPDVIINTINGNTNKVFFKSLRTHGIVPSLMPTVSFSIAEHELSNFDLTEIAGDYAAWSYFENIPCEINQQFVKSYQKKYGQDRVTAAPIESGYLGVHLWAQAVEKAGTEDVRQVRQTIKGLKYRAPEGMVYVDPDNQHTWKLLRIGKVREDGQFDIVWNSMDPIPPVPFPVYRSKAEWEALVEKLYISWGKQWFNQG